MHILIHIYRWILSGWVALALSCVLYSGVSVLDEYFRLHLAANNDPRLLTFLAFPILLPIIHGPLHEGQGAWNALLIAGSVLTTAGGLVYLLGRVANAHHVSMGPFSGLEYVFQMAAGILFASAGGIVILVWILGILFLRSRFSPRTADNA